MSFDRKNKRAAQQALREAQANGQDGGVVTATNVTAQSPQLVNGNGLVQSLRQVDMNGGRLGEYAQLGANGAYGMNGGGPASSSGASDAIFGSPDSVGHRTPASSPGMQHRNLPSSNGPHSPLSFATLSLNSNGNFAAPTASGLSHHFSGSPYQSTVAAQAMLSEQARRLSNTSEQLSPPRIAALSRARLSFNGASAATDLPSSPPLAAPGLPVANGGAAIFGTSPFSGSRGLFIPSSFDSNEDGFPRSPPVRHSGLPDMARSNSNVGWTIQGLAAAEEAIADDDEDGFDEAFLPSSLNDLLTPEEMRRRTLRAHNGLHGPSSLARDSTFLSSAPPSSVYANSQSVPADLYLARGQPSPVLHGAVLPTPPPTAARPVSASVTVPGGANWGMLSSSVEGHNPSALPYEPPTRSLLSQSRTAASVTSTTSTTASPILSSSVSTLDPGERSFISATSTLSAHLNGGLNNPNGIGGGINGSAAPPRSTLSALAGIYSASFNDSAALLPPRYPQSGLSPGTNASLAAPGSSLPGGLAAGLSRLHLVPPSHTGETPPSSLLSTYAAAAAGSQPPSASSTLARSPLAPASALTRRMSTKTREEATLAPPSLSPSQQPQVLLRSPIPVRTHTGLSEGVLSSGTSALGEEDEDEIQFDMDEA
jgi:hypothetical protein